MSDTQPKRPAPPDGYATWLDWATQWLRGVISSFDHARAELAELRADRDSLRESLASAEDAALKELSDTQGLLATARENLVAIDAQRAKAVREMEDVAKIADECVATAKSNEGISVMEWMMRTAMAEKKNKEAQAKLSEAVRERDALRAQLDEINSLEHATAKGPIDMLMNRAHQLKLNAALAQVAELRAAILGLGELTGTEVHAGWGATLRVHIRHDNAQAFNAVVSRLRAEAKEDVGQ